MSCALPTSRGMRNCCCCALSDQASAQWSTRCSIAHRQEAIPFQSAKLIVRRDKFFALLGMFSVNVCTGGRSKVPFRLFRHVKKNCEREDAERDLASCARCS